MHMPSHRASGHGPELPFLFLRCGSVVMRNILLYAVTAGLVVIAAVFGINAYYGASAASTYQKDVRRAWVELRFEHRWIGAQRPIVRIVVFTRFTCGPCQRLQTI